MRLAADAIKKFIGDEQLEGAVFDGAWQSTLLNGKVVEPASGKILGAVGMADGKWVARSAALARKAQVQWARRRPEDRSAVFERAVTIAELHRGVMVDWLIREGGSSRLKAEFEVTVSIKAIKLAGAMPMEAQGILLPSEPGRHSYARRRPLGVVGVISPFNFPLYLAIRAVAPALATGNGVVLKPDPRTAVCGGFVIARIFELAGLPQGLLHVLPGGGEAGEALCSDPNVAMIQFTGSTSAGRMVGQTASRHLKKVSLELGGKNSIIVLDDADLDRAVSAVAWGVYLHQGQICMSAGRVLVQAGIAKSFIQRLSQAAARLKVGNPTAADVVIGPIINRHQFDHIAKVVSASVAQGAVLETGGPGADLFFNPAVLSGVKPGMPVFEEEVFGPVAAITTFETDEEAITLANDTAYGLSAAILSSNLSRAQEMGDRLRTGLLHINDQTVNDEVVNPFGGTGASGNGASIGGPANWEEFTQWQWVTTRARPPEYPF